MMTITKTLIIVVLCLLFSSVPCTHGSQDALLRTKSVTDINTRRLQTLVQLSITDSDLQSAVRELLGYSNNSPMGWDYSMSLSMSMSMNYSSPTDSLTAAPTPSHAVLPSPTTSSSLRPTAGGVHQEPTASPVVVVTPPTQVVAIKGTNSTGGVIGEEEEAGRGRLSVSAITGIIVAGGLILLVAALVTKKVLIRSATPVA